MSEPAPKEYVLTLSCPDRRGIVHGVSRFLLEMGCNILDSQQFGDRDSTLFFMRVHVAAEDPLVTLAMLRSGFEAVAASFGMRWAIHDCDDRMRALILVSRSGHCLNDLLFRHRSGALGVDVAAVASNHPDLGEMAAWHGVPYHHLPLTAQTKAAQEAHLLGLVDQHRVDLVVLARYMQVLSDEMCKRLDGRAINIHHSFLPSFKGARPYHQAHARGVKIVGATAHYVTADLDEGPIIEQEVARVDHAMDPDELAAVGRDLESLVLARAVTWHAQHRVLLNGTRTVVFR
ncbi:MAG: formyltetrahydrofolate deformylase [Carbonactinosporaceae bacterium]